MGNNEGTLNRKFQSLPPENFPSLRIDQSADGRSGSDRIPRHLFKHFNGFTSNDNNSAYNPTMHFAATPSSAMSDALFFPVYQRNADINESHFELTGVIAAGAFGDVLRVIRKKDGVVYAMKVMEKQRLIDEMAVQQCKDEATIQNLTSVFIVMEYIACGELFALWKKLDSFSDSLVQLYVAELAMVLDFLHKSGIIYRDLKMENILIDEQGHLHVTDFGLAKRLKIGQRTGTICGTLQYLAPEVASVEPYGHASDWWSLGILMYALVTGQFPVSRANDHIEMAKKISTTRYSLPADAANHVSHEAQHFLALLLERLPQKRLQDLESVKKHPYLSNINFDWLYHRQLSPRMLEESRHRQHVVLEGEHTQQQRHQQRPLSAESFSPPGVTTLPFTSLNKLNNNNDVKQPLHTPSKVIIRRHSSRNKDDMVVAPQSGKMVDDGGRSRDVVPPRVTSNEDYWPTPGLRNEGTEPQFSEWRGITNNEPLHSNRMSAEMYSKQMTAEIPLHSNRMPAEIHLHSNIMPTESQYHRPAEPISQSSHWAPEPPYYSYHLPTAPYVQSNRTTSTGQHVHFNRTTSPEVYGPYTNTSPERHVLSHRAPTEQYPNNTSPDPRAVYDGTVAGPDSRRGQIPHYNVYAERSRPNVMNRVSPDVTRGIPDVRNEFPVTPQHRDITSDTRKGIVPDLYRDTRILVSSKTTNDIAHGNNMTVVKPNMTWGISSGSPVYPNSPNNQLQRSMTHNHIQSPPRTRHELTRPPYDMHLPYSSPFATTKWPHEHRQQQQQQRVVPVGEMESSHRSRQQGRSHATTRAESLNRNFGELQESRQHDARQQDARQHDARQQDAREHDARQQDARQHDARQHDARQHDARQHDARQHDARQHDARQHDARQHDARQHDARQHDARQHDARQHDARQHDARQHDARQHDARQHDARQQDARQQDARQHDVWQCNVQQQYDPRQFESRQRDLQQNNLRQPESLQLDSRQLDSRQNDLWQQESRQRESRTRDVRQPDLWQHDSRQHRTHNEQDRVTREQKARYQSPHRYKQRPELVPAKESGLCDKFNWTNAVQSLSGFLV